MCLRVQPAISRIEASALEEVIVSNTVPLREPCSKIKQLSVGKLLAETMQRVHTGGSVSGAPPPPPPPLSRGSKLPVPGRSRPAS